MNYNSLAMAVWLVQNQMRTNPKSFIPNLQDRLSRIVAVPKSTPPCTTRADPNTTTPVTAPNDDYSANNQTCDNLLSPPASVKTVTCYNLSYPATATTKAYKVRTHEGAYSIQEAITFLQNQQPLAPLVLSGALSQAAQAHINDCGKYGLRGHLNSQYGNISIGGPSASPLSRTQMFGKVTNYGENIDYGHGLTTNNTQNDYIEGAVNTMLSLCVDDGVCSRDHRSNIFNPAYKVVGIACGYHNSAYKIFCTIDYAATFIGTGAYANLPNTTPTNAASYYSGTQLALGDDGMIETFSNMNSNDRSMLCKCLCSKQFIIILIILILIGLYVSHNSGRYKAFTTYLN